MNATIRETTKPTHECMVCGALWVCWPDGSWSLWSESCGKCCDSMPMGAQIRPVGAA